MTKLSKSDVKRLADLARLRLTDDELAQFSGEFSNILEYVEQLKDVDTDGLKPTYQVNGLSSVTRTDEVVDYKTSKDSLLKNVPKVKGDQIEVKRVL